MSPKPKTLRDCDVLIVGAGMAGAAAAIACDKMNTRTMVVELEPYAGGTAVGMFHRDLCGWFANTDVPPKEPLNGGLAVEFVQRMTQRFGAEIKRMGKVHVLATRNDSLRQMLAGWLAERKRVEILYNARCVGVTKHEQRIQSVQFEKDGMLHRIVPKIVIDASGDGVVVGKCQAMGVDSIDSPQQYAGFAFFVEAIEGSADMLPVQIPYVLTQAVQADELPHYAKFTNFTPVDDSGRSTISGSIKLSLPPEKVQREFARRYALAVHGTLKRRLPSYSRAQIKRMSPHGFHREGPRLLGAYCLTGNDVLEGRKFADGVVRNAWPIEIWDQERGPQLQYLDSGDYYEIPLRSLKSKDFSNLLAAGRCICMSRRALGSVRVTGPCWSLGEQAGHEAGRILNES